MASDATNLSIQRDEFSRAQLTALAELARAGRACSARELAGGHRIGPLTLTLQWLVTKGHVRAEVCTPASGGRPEPVYELTDHGRKIHQRLGAHTPTNR